MVRAKYRPYDEASAGQDDFVAAGLLGLVRAAHEFDQRRNGWVTLYRWRAQECARDLLRWVVRTRAARSLDAGGVPEREMQSENCDLTRLSDGLATFDPEADFLHRDAICAALQYVTGPIGRAIARAYWLDCEGGPSIALRFGIHEDTVYSHLTHAREQVSEALALGRIDPALRGVGCELAAKYGINGRKAAAEKRRERRDRQCRGADDPQADEQRG